MRTDYMQLASDERIVRTVRKHWFILFTEIIGTFLLFIAPVPLSIIVLLFAPETLRAPLENLSVDSIIIFYALWTLVLAGSFFHAVTDYYLDVWVITTERIIAIEQRGLFNRSVGSFHLDKLQNVDVSIVGFIATFLDFGTLRAETAAHDHDFVIRGVANPREIKGLILGIAEKTPTIPSEPETLVVAPLA